MSFFFSLKSGLSTIASTTTSTSTTTTLISSRTAESFVDDEELMTSLSEPIRQEIESTVDRLIIFDISPPPPPMEPETTYVATVPSVTSISDIVDSFDEVAETAPALVVEPPPTTPSLTAFVPSPTDIPDVVIGFSGPTTSFPSEDSVVLTSGESPAPTLRGSASDTEVPFAEIGEESVGIELENAQKPAIVAIYYRNMRNGFPESVTLFIKKLFRTDLTVKEYVILRKNILVERDFQELARLQSNQITFDSSFDNVLNQLPDYNKASLMTYTDNSVQSNCVYAYRVKVIFAESAAPLISPSTATTRIVSGFFR